MSIRMRLAFCFGMELTKSRVREPIDWRENIISDNASDEMTKKSENRKRPQLVPHTMPPFFAFSSRVISFSNIIISTRKNDYQERK